MNRLNTYYLVTLLTIAMISCGNNTSDAATTSTATKTAKTADGSQFDNIDAETADDPIKGGPADFTLTVTDNPFNGRVSLIGLYMDQNFLADTAIAKNGVVTFKDPEGYAQGLYYLSLPKDRYVQLLLGEDQKFTMEVDSRNITATMKVQGSIDNEMYYESTRKEASWNPKLQKLAKKMALYPKLSTEYMEVYKEKEKLDDERLAYLTELAAKAPKSLFSKFKIGGQNPKLNLDLPENKQVEAYRNEFWDNVDLTDKRLLRTPIINNKLNRFMTELTPQMPQKLIESAEVLMSYDMDPEVFKNFANWIVLKYEPTKTDLMDPEAVFVHMIQKYFTKERAYWAEEVQVNAFQERAHTMAQSLVGNDAPNVISTDQNGKTQKLLDKTADYLVVYMYNPDCEHCQEQTPQLLDYWKKSNGEVDVFAIAIETDDQKWKNYIKKNNLTWTNVFDPSNRSIYAKYYVDITPELYVINQDRKIIGKNLKVFQIDTIIERDKASKK